MKLVLFLIVLIFFGCQKSNECTCEFENVRFEEVNRNVTDLGKNSEKIVTYLMNIKEADNTNLLEELKRNNYKLYENTLNDVFILGQSDSLIVASGSSFGKVINESHNGVSFCFINLRKKVLISYKSIN